jgi:hypothetical protein
MFKVHASLKRAFLFALVVFASSTGVASASTPGQGPGSSGDTSIPTTGWVMIYEGCGLCGLQGDQPDNTPYVPGIGTGDGSGGYVELTSKGTYPSSSSETDTTITTTRGIQYTNGLRLEFTQVENKTTGLIASITATLENATGSQVFANVAVAPDNLSYTGSSVYEIAFQNGYVLYIPYEAGGEPLEVFRPV